MPRTEKPRPRAPRDRAPAEPAAACELRPFAHPVSDALVLAAAERHRRTTRTDPGVLLGDVFAHMGFIYNGAATRQLRPRLDALLAKGALEQIHRHSIKLWVLTSAGRRCLAQVSRRDGPVQLPESPQHRMWRHERESAAERIEGYRGELQALVEEAGALLASGTAARSDRWLAWQAGCGTPRDGSAWPSTAGPSGPSPTTAVRTSTTTTTPATTSSTGRSGPTASANNTSSIGLPPATATAPTSATHGARSTTKRRGERRARP